MDSEILAPLSFLGLDADDSSVYRVLIESGPRPAGLIARAVRLKRGHTYNILARLHADGIVSEVPRTKVKTYAAVPPRALLRRFQERMDELSSAHDALRAALPVLESAMKRSSIEPRVRIFSGEEGIKDIYEDTLCEHGGIIHALVDYDSVFPRERNERSHAWIWKYCERRARRGIAYHGIVNRSKLSDKAYTRRKKELRVMKMLTGVRIPAEINIYGDKIAILSTHREMFGVVIESEAAADSLRELHRAVWELLPEYEPGESRQRRSG